MKQYAIGIDLGGTMIKYAIVSSDGEIIYQSSTLTPLDKGGNGIVDAFIVAAKAAIDEASQRGVEISGIGIGTPGIVSKDGRTVVGGAENLPEWHNLPLADSLEIPWPGNCLIHQYILATDGSGRRGYCRSRFFLSGKFE